LRLQRQRPPATLPTHATGDIISAIKPPHGKHQTGHRFCVQPSFFSQLLEVKMELKALVDQIAESHPDVPAKAVRSVVVAVYDSMITELRGLDAGAVKTPMGLFTVQSRPSKKDPEVIRKRVSVRLSAVTSTERAEKNNSDPEVAARRAARKAEGKPEGSAAENKAARQAARKSAKAKEGAGS